MSSNNDLSTHTQNKTKYIIYFVGTDIAAEYKYDCVKILNSLGSNRNLHNRHSNG